MNRGSTVALACALGLLACSSGGSGGAAADGGLGSAPGALGGWWSCDLTTSHEGTEGAPGEQVLTSVQGTSLTISAETPYDLSAWFCSPMAVSGSSAEVSAPFACSPPPGAASAISITSGEVVLQSDGTLAIEEQGQDAQGVAASIAGSCTRMPAPSSSSGGGSSGGGPPPQCSVDADCGCGYCNQGECVLCIFLQGGICSCP